VIALASDYATARGAYEEAIKRRPERIVTSRQKIKGAGRQPVKDMARIYVSESGRDKNDGPTKQTPIYSWKRARKISGHIEITVDSAATRKRGRPSLYVGRRDAAVAATSEEFLNAWQSRNLRAGISRVCLFSWSDDSTHAPAESLMRMTSPLLKRSERSRR
jgi:hypothetical protein